MPCETLCGARALSIRSTGQGASAFACKSSQFASERLRSLVRGIECLPALWTSACCAGPCPGRCGDVRSWRSFTNQRPWPASRCAMPHTPRNGCAAKSCLPRSRSNLRSWIRLAATATTIAPGVLDLRAATAVQLPKAPLQLRAPHRRIDPRSQLLRRQRTLARAQRARFAFRYERLSRIHLDRCTRYQSHLALARDAGDSFCN